MIKQKQKVHNHSCGHPTFSASELLSDRRNHFASLKTIKQRYSIANSSKNIKHQTRDKLISKVSSHLMRKLIIDDQTSKALQQHDEIKLKRLQRIEAQIEMINQQNALQIKQLSQMENTFLKKMEGELQKDRKIEEKLLREYNKLKKEEEQVYITKNVKKIMENEDWSEIQKHQKKLELLARSFQKMQHVMGRDKSADFKKKDKKNVQEKHIRYQSDKLHKRERKKQNVEEMKEMGRQFLQHAKKVQAERLRERNCILDIDKKSIDYLPQLKVLMKNNASDLSIPLESYRSKKKKSRRSSPPKIGK